MWHSALSFSALVAAGVLGALLQRPAATTWKAAAERARELRRRP
jgi:hypothetical protein